MTDDDFTFDPWGKEQDPPADGTTDEERALDLAAEKARDVEREIWRQDVRDDARRKRARRDRQDLERPQSVRLDKLLAREYDDPTYRIDGLWPTGGRMLLAAQWKAGKTTLVANLIRALVDGEPFLGQFLPRQARHVYLIDDELDPRTLQLWFRQQAITNADRVTILPIRGKIGAFDILGPDARAEWAADIKADGTDVLLLDCLRPLFDAFGLDENHEAGKFLVALDALMAEADVSEGGVIHHMGHAAERSRGDSRLLDWPDALWKIVRDKDEDDESGHADDPSGSRYFSAYGRDVDQAQAELVYDPATRRLSLGTKTRHQATEHRKIVRADNAVVTAVQASPGINKTKLRKACSTYGITNHQQIDEAVERLVEDGVIVRQMFGQQRLHYPAKKLEMLSTEADRAQHAQNDVGTVNPPLTRHYPQTAPESGGQGDIGQQPALDKLVGRGGNRTAWAGLPYTVPDAYGPAARYTEAATVPKPVGHGQVDEARQPCPSCGTNPLAPGQRRCGPCQRDLDFLTSQEPADD